MGGECCTYGEGRGVYRDLVGKPEGKITPGDPGVDGRIILGLIFKKWDVSVRTGLGWLRIGQVACACECGEKHSGSIKRVKFLD
jgi:hypothetical protein